MAKLVTLKRQSGEAVYPVTITSAVMDSNGNPAEVVFAKIQDIINGNITAAKAATADSTNAIGGKGLSDLVQGGGTIKHIKVVTSLPANPSNDTLYLIKQ
jgi:hypothetical protein